MKVVLLLLVLASVLSCSPKRHAPQPDLSERQRDSVLSRSGLPGARTVGRALLVQDRAATRAVNIDSLPR